MRQNWRLVRTEVTVRRVNDRRYRVDAYLTMDAPSDAHPERYVGPVRLRFPGDADAQRLKLLDLTLNDRTPDRRLVAVQPTGTGVMASIEKTFRTAPWAIYLSVELDARGGRLAMPRHESSTGQASAAPMTVTWPDGRIETFDTGADAVVVDADAASAVSGTPRWVWIGATAGLATLAVVAIWRRRRRIARER